MAAKGQPYGEAGKQMDAQSVVPVAAPPLDLLQPTQPQPQPGSLPRLDAQTDRPNEPITSGMSFGAGPGPEAMVAPRNMAPAPGSNFALAEQVRAIAALYPNPTLLQLLADLEA